MSDDLVKRLRDLSYNQGHDLPDKAADRIEKLERENNDTALHLYAFASRIEKLEDELHHCFHRINELQAALRAVIDWDNTLESEVGLDWAEVMDIASKALEGKND